jgi:hypothetical protein
MASGLYGPPPLGEQMSQQSGSFCYSTRTFQASAAPIVPHVAMLISTIANHTIIAHSEKSVISRWLMILYNVLVGESLGY